MILSGIRNITLLYLNDIKCEFCFHLETSTLITLASSATQLTLWDVQRPTGSHREKHVGRALHILVYELLLICLLCNLPLKTGNSAALGPPLWQGHCCSRTLKILFSRFCYCWEVQSHSDSRTFVGGFFFLSLWNLNNQLSPFNVLKFCNNLTWYVSIFTHQTEHLVDPFSLAIHFLQFWKIILTYSLNISTMCVCFFPLFFFF